MGRMVAKKSSSRWVLMLMLLGVIVFGATTVVVSTFETFERELHHRSTRQLRSHIPPSQILMTSDARIVQENYPFGDDVDQDPLGLVAILSEEGIPNTINDDEDNRPTIDLQSTVHADDDESAEINLETESSEQQLSIPVPKSFELPATTVPVASPSQQPPLDAKTSIPSTSPSVNSHTIIQQKQQPPPLSRNDFHRIPKCRRARGAKLVSGELHIPTWTTKVLARRVAHDEAFHPPSASRLKRLIKALSSSDWDVRQWKSLPALATSSGYTICRIEHMPNRQSVVIAWMSKFKGDMSLFTRHAALEQDSYRPVPLVLQLPHIETSSSLEQAFHLFQDTDASALLLSTSHRCARAPASGCSGIWGESSRTTCPRRSRYTMANVAHATRTTFHVAHTVLVSDTSTEEPNSKHKLRPFLTVSLDGANTDRVVVSDGTDLPTVPLSPVHMFEKALGSVLPVTTCNALVGIGDAMTISATASPSIADQVEACGLSNVQGRFMNGAVSNACTLNTTSSITGVDRTKASSSLLRRGQFLHVQQPYDGLSSIPGSIPVPASIQSHQHGFTSDGVKNIPDMTSKLGRALVSTALDSFGEEGLVYLSKFRGALAGNKGNALAVLE